MELPHESLLGGRDGIRKAHIMNFGQLKQELKNYYSTISLKNPQVTMPFNPLQAQMDSFAAAHPELTPAQLKMAQYQIIADGVKPVLFPQDPFFYETGLRAAEYDGHTSLGAGGWLLRRNLSVYSRDFPEDYERYLNAGRLGLHLAYGPFFDYDHHCFPYSRVMEKGLCGIYEDVCNAANETADPEKMEFYQCAQAGLLAVKKIAEKFAAEAKKKLDKAPEEEKESLSMILSAAAQVPWNPPRTFYEGLAAMKFLYEMGCIMEGVGMSVLGAPDRLLYHLYRDDLEQGRLTESEAYKLVSIWMIHTDCRLQLEKNVAEQFNAGEQGDTLILGGTDAAGKDITNELSAMFLKAHKEHSLIYPKIHCRISENTPEWFLEETAKEFLNGRNVLSYLNDDVIIPAQCMAGKEVEDAANYMAGGCWEIILESAEQSEGAHCYFSLGRVMDLVIQSTAEEEEKLGLRFIRPDKAENFEEFYSICLSQAEMALRSMLEDLAKYGKLWREINPAPFLSVCMKNCVESGKDYTAGGAKYSPHGVPLTGVAIYINSLLAVKDLCFERKLCTLPHFLEAVRNNWEGAEDLRQYALQAPHLGDGGETSTALANRFLNEMADFIGSFTNERGGKFQAGLYSYVDVVQWAPRTRATPDGRFNGDFLSAGLTPTRLHGDVITDVFRTTSKLPLKRFPASSVMTLSLSSAGLDGARFKALIRSWQTLGSCAMLQLNCLTRELLEDAVKNPQNHQDLVVRLYGLSVRFVTLDPQRQQEFITRMILE